MRKTSIVSRVLAVALAAALLTGALSACGGTEKNRSLSVLTPTQSIEPLMNKLAAEDSGVTFDVHPYYGAAVSVYI